MRAAFYEKTGPPSVLQVGELPTPEPGPGEVRVRVALSGVNPTDWKSRSGLTAADPPWQQVPHHDGAGVIDAVGEGVAPARVGERVWVYMAASANRWGTAAEYSVVPAERALPLPANASDALGASLGVPAVTAAHCLLVGAAGGRAGLNGARVLVAGGAGAVGHFAIELAKHAGAEVATTVSSPEKAELATKAGADLVVNYRTPGAAEELQAFSRRFDRIVEVALGANMSLDLAVSGPGTFIAVYASEASDPVLPTRRLMAANVTVHWLLLYLVPKVQLAAAVSWVAEALEGGALSELPARTFPLEEVAAAQEAVERGALGKVFVAPQ
jgi:NADPH2:quinone reductase